jgi:hypothetical protein
MAEFQSLDNKWLTVAKNVILTDNIDRVIAELDPFFESEKYKSRVTSGLRTPEDQLRIIRSAVITHRLADEYSGVFDDIEKKVQYGGEEIYSWQLGWSKLLNLGFIVNPPYNAKVLLDYVRPGSTENKKGKMIYQSPHTRGTAFDIGGGPDGLDKELEIVKSAKDKIRGLRGYLLERNNNCLHVDCWDRSIGMKR